MNEVIFSQGSVPVAVAAKVFGKDPAWVRAGLIYGWLPIGYATRGGEAVRTMEKKQKRTNYYISPKKFYELTGFIW